jgi:hypothetical protein
MVTPLTAAAAVVVQAKWLMQVMYLYKQVMLYQLQGHSMVALAPMEPTVAQLVI